MLWSFLVLFCLLRPGTESDKQWKDIDMQIMESIFIQIRGIGEEWGLSQSLQLSLCRIFFYIFQLQFTFNIILYEFQVYSIVVRQSYTLPSVPPNISSTLLVPYMVITVLLTIFLMLCFTSLGLFCNYQFVLLNCFIFFTYPPTHLPSGIHQSVL